MTQDRIIYGSVYSGVSVYEMQCRGVAVMRRRADSYLNATQLLKVAQIDKGKRTKILEREVQIPGQTFEKVQGGYGKYQGTWVPFERGVEVAQQYGVAELLQPLIEYQPTADATADRALFDQTPGKRRKLSNASQSQLPSQSHLMTQHQVQVPQLSNNEKYRAMLMSVFLGHESHRLPPLLTQIGAKPADLDADMIIDDQGHTALHWASALARVNVLHMLIANLQADVMRVNFNGESALVRAILVTNCYETDTFVAVVAALGDGVLALRDNKGRTVLHHIVLTASIKGRMQASKYYLETLLQFMREMDAEREDADTAPPFISTLIDVQDKNGDTALNIAARLGNKQLVETLVVQCGADCESVNRCGLRPVDFAQDDAALKEVFAQRMGEGAVMKPSELFGGALQSQMFTSAIGTQVKSRQLSQEFEEVVKSLEMQLAEKDRQYQDAVAQVQSLGKELSEVRKQLSQSQLNLSGVQQHNQSGTIFGGN